VLLHLVDGGMSPKEIGKAYATVRNEISAYGHGLDTKREIIGLNKVDLMSSGDMERKRRVLAELAGVTALPLSGEQGVGITEVLRALAKAIDEVRRENPPPYHADPQSVRETESLEESDAPPTSKGWSP
jgi:GTP-binding protein